MQKPSTKRKYKYFERHIPIEVRTIEDAVKETMGAGGRPWGYDGVWVYERWDISARGTGTVTRRRYDLDGSGRWLPADEVGELIVWEAGGFTRARFRKAKCKIRAVLPRGAIRESRIDSYVNRKKVGTITEYHELDIVLKGGVWVPVWVRLEPTFLTRARA